MRRNEMLAQMLFIEAGEEDEIDKTECRKSSELRSKLDSVMKHVK